MYYSVEPENFYEEAKKYINNILEAMGVDLSRPVCLDQPFEGNAPQQSFPFFDDPYAVVIDRDPRDLYLAGKYTKDPNFKFTPKKNVDDFIIYYKKNIFFLSVFRTSSYFFRHQISILNNFYFLLHKFLFDTTLSCLFLFYHQTGWVYSN